MPKSCGPFLTEKLVCVSVSLSFLHPLMAPVRSVSNPCKVSAVLLFRVKPQILRLEELAQMLRVSIALAEDQYPHADMRIALFKINLIYTKLSDPGRPGFVSLSDC